jgi:hypothetical protein
MAYGRLEDGGFSKAEIAFGMPQIDEHRCHQRFSFSD